MDILALVASRRSPGNSELLALEAAAGAEMAGAKVEKINMADLNIKACAGCLRCVFKGSCSGDDDMGMLLQKLLHADGLIVSAPTYLLSPAAIIKRIVDRGLMMSLYIDELAERRRGAVTISVAGKNDWNPLGMEMLNQFSLVYGYPVVDYLEAFAPGPGEILLQDEVVSSANQQGKRLVEYLQGKAEAKPAAANQCPCCYSRSFRLLGGNRVQCPFCLVEGTIAPDGTIHIPDEVLEDNFWTPGHRKRHLEDWIKATRGVFLQNREEVKERLKKYY
jgi:multimeric flavodoxin WrbA